MNEKKILIFEDEWQTNRGPFEMANLFAFNGALSFEVCTKSQEVSFTSWNEQYAAVFVDITLSKNSKLDGYNIIKSIIAKQLIDLDKVVILTGNSKIQEKLKELQIDPTSITIMTKPIAFNDLSDVLQKLLDN